MSTLLELIFVATGNKAAQKMLSKIANYAQFFMGIGTGTHAELSGEKGVFNLLCKRFQSPYCIFDVGSNMGQYLNLIVSRMGEECSDIHCFEPGQETFSALRNSAPNSSKIKLNNCALGQIEGEAQLHYDEKTSGLASLTKRKLDHFNIYFEKSELVKIDTIDNYCARNNIRRIHLLKIDVEGHELDVLAGAKNMFEQQAIDVVTFEFGGCNIDTRSFFQDFYYFFHNVGMKIYRITPSGYICPIESYTEILEQFRTTNFVAAKDAF